MFLLLVELFIQAIRDTVQGLDHGVIEMCAKYMDDKLLPTKTKACFVVILRKTAAE